MNNEQLAILIRSWANRLENEIDRIRMELPESMGRLTDRVYVGKQLVSFFDYDPKSYEDRPGEFFALLGIKSLLEELRQAESELGHKTEEKV